MIPQPQPRPGEVLARVDGELRALWSQPPAPGETPKARACTTNLVVVAATPELMAQWIPIVDEVVQSVPARAIVVGLDPDGADALEASVSAVCAPDGGGGAVARPPKAAGADGIVARPPKAAGADGIVICSERVTLVVRGGLCARLPSCVESLCLADVPTTLVWLGRVHGDDPSFGPLAADAGRIVLDAAHGSLASVAHVVAWARARAAGERGERPGVADLAWTRLGPWRELCARMFDEPDLRALAGHVTRVTLVQRSAEGAPLGAEGSLMLGWLATRLGWKVASLAGKLRLVRADGGTVGVVLRAAGGGEARGTLEAVGIEAAGRGLSMTGEVVREGEGATWRLQIDGGSPASRRLEQREQRVRLGATDEARLLEKTLRRPAHDEALAESATWAEELRGEELACG